MNRRNFVLSLIALLIAVAFSVNVKAANETYKAKTRIDCHWDIHNNNKPVWVKLRPVYNTGKKCSTGMNIFIGKKKMYQVKRTFYSYQVKFVNLDNGEKYIYLLLKNKKKYAPGHLIHYKDKAFVEELNLQKSVGKLGKYFRTQLPIEKKASLSFVCWSMSKGLGPVYYKVNYKYNKSKLVKTSNTHKILGYPTIRKGQQTVTTIRPIRIYKDPAGKKLIKRLSTGTKVKITKICLTDAYCAYYIKGHGWLRYEHAVKIPCPAFKQLKYLK